MGLQLPYRHLHQSRYGIDDAGVEFMMYWCLVDTMRWDVPQGSYILEGVISIFGSPYLPQACDNLFSDKLRPRAPVDTFRVVVDAVEQRVFFASETQEARPRTHNGVIHL